MKYIVVLALVACVWAAPNPPTPDLINDGCTKIDQFNNVLKNKLQNVYGPTAVVIVKEQIEALESSIKHYVDGPVGLVEEYDVLMFRCKIKETIVKEVQSVLDNNPHLSAQQLLKQFIEVAKTFLTSISRIAETIKSRSRRSQAPEIDDYSNQAVEISVSAARNLKAAFDRAASGSSSRHS